MVASKSKFLCLLILFFIVLDCNKKTSLKPQSLTSDINLDKFNKKIDLKILNKQTNTIQDKFYRFLKKKVGKDGKEVKNDKKEDNFLNIEIKDDNNAYNLKNKHKLYKELTQKNSNKASKKKEDPEIRRVKKKKNIYNWNRACVVAFICYFIGLPLSFVSGALGFGIFFSCMGLSILLAKNYREAKISGKKYKKYAKKMKKLEKRK